MDRSPCLFILLAFTAACAQGAVRGGTEKAPSSLTVDSASSTGCSTAIVRGLAEQLVAEANCLNPGALAPIDSLPNVVLGDGASGAPYLHPDAAAALARAAARRSVPLHVNSALRTLPQQYLVQEWLDTSSCGVTRAARPGSSNHEQGLAVDVDDHAGWQAALEAEGFVWKGSADVVHFDYTLASNPADMSVRAFQTLWNEAHPDDAIGVDGVYGPATETRLVGSPSEGFAHGPLCGASAPPPSGGSSSPGSSDPPPASSTGGPDCSAGHGCADCNAIDYACGFCASTGQCLVGGSAGPTAGTCVSGWQWISPSSCPGTTTPPPAPLPSSSGGALITSSGYNTYYYVPQAADYAGGDDTTLYDSSCNPIGYAPAAFSDAACVEGTGMLSDGTMLNYDGTCSCGRPCPTGGVICWRPLSASYPWGAGAGSQPLEPLVSIAADPSVIAQGTVVYIDAFDGLYVPSVDGLGGYTHDGCFRVDDVGGAIAGGHVDVFAGSAGMWHALEGLVPTHTSFTIREGGDRCAGL